MTKQDLLEAQITLVMDLGSDSRGQETFPFPCTPLRIAIALSRM